MILKIKSFSSSLPCSVDKYDFTNGSKEVFSKLRSYYEDRKIIKSGHFSDFYKCTELESFVIYRSQNITTAFRWSRKGNRNIYDSIDGLRMPKHPEALVTTNGAYIYVLKMSDTRDKSMSSLDWDNLGDYFTLSRLTEGHVILTAWLNKASQKVSQGFKLGKEFISQIRDVYNPSGNTFIQILLSEDAKKISVAQYDDNLRLVSSWSHKAGSPTQGFMESDLHNHLLPGVDDGAENQSVSVVLAKELINLGIDKVVLTPHNNEDYHDLDGQKEVFEELLGTNYPVELYLSSENNINDDFMSGLGTEDEVRSHPNEWYLIEYDKDESRKYILNTLGPIQAILGRCILAHPERYIKMESGDEYLLAGSSMLIQCNAKSLVQDKEDKARDQVQVYDDSDLIDILATDLHREAQLDEIHKSVDRFNGIYLNKFVL